MKERSLSRCYLNALGMTCAAGDTSEQIRTAMAGSHLDCLTSTDAFTPGRLLMLGLCSDNLARISLDERRQHSRNNRLLLTAYEQIRPQVELAIARFGAKRIAIILGTSTSGIAETEAALTRLHNQGKLSPEYHYFQQEMGAPAHFLAKISGAQGPSYSISTACSSSARALASGRRLLRLGVVDAVICGGVDSLCRLTVQGFSALASVSPERCNPFSVNRNGINIGEGAALFLMTREESEVQLSGTGEGSDAHHISAPDPQGRGAMRAISAALTDAGLEACDIDYINLHGTATPQNDRMEALAVQQLFGSDVACSSSKPFTGHTLGAAGAIEAGLCYLALTAPPETPFLPPHLWDGDIDSDLMPLNLITNACVERRPARIISNSFAFGGNNVSLLLEHS